MNGKLDEAVSGGGVGEVARTGPGGDEGAAIGLEEGGAEHAAAWIWLHRFGKLDGSPGQIWWQAQERSHDWPDEDAGTGEGGDGVAGQADDDGAIGRAANIDWAAGLN